MVHIQQISGSVRFRRRFLRTVYHVFMLAVGFVMIYPLLWLVSSLRGIFLPPRPP